VEFTLGVEHLKEAGFSVYVHPQCSKRHLFFAGNDSERAQAFYEFAISSQFPVVWCARGGYGSFRILSWLEKYTAERGIPDPKLLVGYSDSTALMEYVRNRWHWSTLHAPMPGLREFSLQKSAEWKTLQRLVKGKELKTSPWGKRKLRFLSEAPRKRIRAEMIGGNLTVWTSMVGTRFAPQTRGRILFFEDVGEPLYRVDRMVQQLAAAGQFDEAKGIVLGEFHNCLDVVPRVLVSVPERRKRSRVLRSPDAQDLGELRPSYSQKRALQEIFGPIGKKYGFPVAQGLPAGHGQSHAPVPLGATVELTPDGNLLLYRWDWLTDR
jgi:muramoyltetrapeptide carboxypeptidase